MDQRAVTEETQALRKMKRVLAKVDDVDALKKAVLALTRACLHSSRQAREAIKCYQSTRSAVVVKHGKTCGHYTPCDRELEDCANELVIEAHIIGGYAVGAVETTADELE